MPPTPKALTEDELRMIEWRTRYLPSETEAAGDSWPQAALDRWNLLCHIAYLEEMQKADYWGLREQAEAWSIHHG